MGKGLDEVRSWVPFGSAGRLAVALCRLGPVDGVGNDGEGVENYGVEMLPLFCLLSADLRHVNSSSSLAAASLAASPQIQCPVVGRAGVCGYQCLVVVLVVTWSRAAFGRSKRAFGARAARDWGPRWAAERTQKSCRPARWTQQRARCRQEWTADAVRSCTGWSMAHALATDLTANRAESTAITMSNHKE